jgi:hypothetical protein
VAVTSADTLANRLPRAGLLGAWLRAWRTGLVPLDDVVTVVTAGDGEHLVIGLADGAETVLAPPGLDAVPLKAGLAAFSRVTPDGIRVVLPAPGDPRGLPPRHPFAAAALTAGEALVIGDTGLVPEPEERRSGSGDIWQTVTWRGFGGLPATGPDPLPVGDADRELLEALHAATAELVRLDVARWRPEIGGALDGIRRVGTVEALPPGFDQRARQLLARSSTVAGAVALAVADGVDGSVSAREGGARADALRLLGIAARRAMIAAFNAPLVG